MPSASRPLDPAPAAPTSRRSARGWRLACLVLPLVLPFVAACSNDSLSACADPTFDGPVLTISELRNSATNTTLPTVTLTDLRIGSTRITRALDVVQSGAPPRNAVAEGSTILCTLACGFGAAEGSYTFTLRRTGFLDTTVTVAASFQTVDRSSGGCMTRASNGSSVALRMAPQEKN